VQAPEKNAKRHADYLTVLCPTTQSSIQTSVTTDVRALAKAWHSKIKVSCLHCGEVHLVQSVRSIRRGGNFTCPPQRGLYDSRRPQSSSTSRTLKEEWIRQDYAMQHILARVI